MPAKRLPLINLNASPSPALVSEIKASFQWYGAVRLAIPQEVRYHPGDALQNVGELAPRAKGSPLIAQ